MKVHQNELSRQLNKIQLKRNIFRRFSVVKLYGSFMENCDIK